MNPRFAMPMNGAQSARGDLARTSHRWSKEIGDFRVCHVLILDRVVQQCGRAASWPNRANRPSSR